MRQTRSAVTKKTKPKDPAVLGRKIGAEIKSLEDNMGSMEQNQQVKAKERIGVLNEQLNVINTGSGSQPNPAQPNPVTQSPGSNPASAMSSGSELPYGFVIKSTQHEVDERLQNVPSTIVGHDRKGNYVVQYGDGITYTFLPVKNPGVRLLENYDYKTNVAHTKDRILDKIVKWHREEGMPLPISARYVMIQGIYWDSKQETGHMADVETLLGNKCCARCLVYINPKVYSGMDWGISNNSGLSWETKTTVLSFLTGTTLKKRKLALYNIAAKMENDFEKTFIKNPVGDAHTIYRSLSEIEYTVNTEPEHGKGLQRFMEDSKESPFNARVTRSSFKKAVKSNADLEEPGEKFQRKFCDMFNLPNTKYEDLPEEYKTLWPTVYYKWLERNVAEAA